MKLLNTVLREILLFLEFKDIVNSNLAFVNKQFFHNIVQDTELLRRMLDIAIPLVKDYARQEQYYASVTSEILRLKHQHLMCDEEFKEPEIQLQRLYEYSIKDLASFLHLMTKQEFKMPLVCTTRSSGGAETSSEQCISAFLDLGTVYYSAKESKFTNGVLCVTGIFLEENAANEAEAKQLLDRVIQIQSEIGHPSIEEEKEDYSRIKNLLKYGDCTIEEIQGATEPSKIYTNKYRNRLVYNVQDQNYQEENTNIEHDVLVHKELMKDKLFCWNEVHVSKIRESATCPIRALVVFTHDYPIRAEEHPLVHIVKDMYKSSKVELSLNPIIPDEDNFGSDEDMKFMIDDPENLKDKFTSNSESGLNPRIINAQDHMLEFDQNFYSSKFNSTSQDSPMNIETLEKAISEIDSDGKYMEMLNKLKSKDDFFRIRLAAIAFGLNTHYHSYTFQMKEIKTGRFVTILGLEQTVSEQFLGVNMDIGGILFTGNFLPNLVKPLP
ncbi:unnamed protein product [Moneuplotes crassus]|uniref:F-box domain-containing protein n=1 Tax=Euplotes crassus TaxID=5936 RepID=A0AAD1TZJ6_EUPCR|nr:unnamed protein product [Moneuplotes crassus]